VGRSVILWIVAFVMMASAGYYQRRTGPTHPLRGAVEIGPGESLRYSLVRSGTTGEDAIVELPRRGVFSASLQFRRLGVDEPFTSVDFTVEGDRFAAPLPTQPPAGKLEYFVTVETMKADPRLPAGADEYAVIRFKDPVPAGVLVPHIAVMFLSMMVGLRAALGALFAPKGVRSLVVVTLLGLTAGGLILGPIVQKHAFGEYWTGWPVGGDLTDSKTLFMWGGWLLAMLFLGRRRPITKPRRAVVVLAALVMLAAYLVPHSLRGSALDYEQLERGVPAEDAIRTG